MDDLTAKNRQIDIDSCLKAMGCDYDIPPIYANRDDDGSFTLEWIFADTRIGLIIGPKPDDHGWFVVGKRLSASGDFRLTAT